MQTAGVSIMLCDEREMESARSENIGKEGNSEHASYHKFYLEYGAGDFCFCGRCHGKVETNVRNQRADARKHADVASEWRQAHRQDREPTRQRRDSRWQS